MKLALTFILTALVSIAGTAAFMLWTDNPMLPNLPARIAPPIGIEQLPSPFPILVRGQMWYAWSARNVPDKFFKYDLAKRHAQAITVCSEKAIIYDPERTDDLRNVLWHELFHAGACDMDQDGHGDATFWNNKGDGDHDHPGIQHLADFVEELTRSNPMLVHWETE